MPNLDFDLTVLTEPVLKKEEIQLTKSRKQDLSNVSYTLSFLAKLEDTQQLEGNVKKARDIEAKGGIKYSIIFLNKTCVVLRREYTVKSKLLVVIPEKAIYNIYDEMSGKLLARHDMKQINTFLMYLPDEMLRTIHDTLIWDLGYSKGEYRKDEYVYFMRATSSKVIDLALNNRMAEMVAYASKQKYSLLGKNEFYRVLSLATRYRHADEKFRVAVKALHEGIEVDFITSVLEVRCENLNVLDINMIRNIWRTTNELHDIILSKPYADKIGNRWNDGKYKISAENVTRLKDINVDFKSWLDWMEYVLLVEEYNLFANFSHYFDVLNQQKQLNNGKIREKYPKMWLTYENKIQSIYRRNERFLKEKKEFTYSEAIQDLEHVTAKENRDWRHILKLPRTYGDIIEEGANMNNCVANYGDRIYRNETVILLMRRKRKPFTSWMTVEVRENTSDPNKVRYNMSQMKGISNTYPTDEAIWYLVKWANLEQNKDKIVITDTYVLQQIASGAVQRHDDFLKQQEEESKKAIAPKGTGHSYIKQEGDGLNA